MPSGVNTVRRFGCLEGESLCLFLDGFPKIIFVILDLGGKSNVQGYSGIFWNILGGNIDPGAREARLGVPVVIWPTEVCGQQI